MLHISSSMSTTEDDVEVREEHKVNVHETQEETHPLEINDRLAFERIKTVRLDFLTDEATSPIPRCQDLPSHAFGTLTGRSILVSLSHGWLFQNHPDPYGAKLDLVKNKFGPQLKERFPHTNIQIFYDFLSLPQNPRTDDEEDVFVDAIERMNSMYVYADVILFIEVDLPDLDMTVHTATVDITKYTFFEYIDTTQVFKTTSNTGPQQGDCILTCSGIKVVTCSQIAKFTGPHSLTYLRRPFGRLNTTPTEDRGWVFLERITVAVKLAAADKARFDDIVVSNSEKLRTKILIWSEQLRDAARKQNTEPKSLRNILNKFEDEFSSKTFTSALNSLVVSKLMSSLILQFAENWKGEVEKQKSMSKRAREILLRWGCFSEDYVERAELLCDSGNRTSVRRSWIMLSIIVGVIAPIVAALPYIFSLEENLEDPSRDGLIVSSAWLGCILGVFTVLLLHALNLAFAKIPIGVHTLCAFMACCGICVFISLAMRSIFTTIMPFEAICIAIVGIPTCDIVYGMIKFIPVKDDRTGLTKRWGVGTWLHMPAQYRFDLKARAAVKRVLRTTHFTCCFGLAYPLLGGLFFQSGIFLQAILIPVFFILRAGFEYGADALTSHTFGSDGMPAINFVGVLQHELCLSVMITSIKHPLVFVSLVLSDVLENTFCLWSLARNTKRSSNRVSIADNNAEEGVRGRRKSLARRSSNMVSLVISKDSVSERGTALFIAATLLQREAIETLVPVQAAAILSLLYVVNVKSNSIVSGWSEDDWNQTMTYIGMDLGVELIVFAGTIFVLRQIYPEFNAGRILRGLLRMHWVEIAMLSVVIWIANLFFQSTYAGMDMSMKFSWVTCKGSENSTWLGGFEWEC